MWSNALIRHSDYNVCTNTCKIRTWAETNTSFCQLSTIFKPGNFEIESPIC